MDWQDILLWEVEGAPTTLWPLASDIPTIETFSKHYFSLPADVTLFSEEDFRKSYLINISDGKPYPSQYLLSVSSPFAEPFYETASEVATLSYLREHTTIPVPRVISHRSTPVNELACQWVLMELAPGVPLKAVWEDMVQETKDKVKEAVTRFVHELRDPKRHFTAFGNLYFRKDIEAFDSQIRVSSMKDDAYVIGPFVEVFTSSCRRKPRASSDLGPYSNHEEYADAQVPAVDEDLDEDIVKEIAEMLSEHRRISEERLSSQFADFTLNHHHELSMDNIFVDPGTYEVSGVIRWEYAAIRPRWEEDTEFLSLNGPSVE